MNPTSSQGTTELTPRDSVASAGARYLDAERRLWESLGVEPRVRRLRLPHVGAEVRVQEIGDGPPLLFVHGGSTCGTSWADLAASLPGRRCLLVDRPGTGLSTAPAAPVRDVDALVRLADRFIPDVLDSLGVDGSAVVATSFGGWFALRTALAAPNRVNRLVMLGWTAGAPVDRLPALLRLGLRPVIGDLLDRLPVNRSSVRAIFRGIGSGPAVADGRISAEAIDAYAALLRWTPTLRNARSLGRLFFSATAIDDRVVIPHEDRARIQIPIDWFWGGRDVFGGEAIARSFVAPFPDLRLEIAPEAGHAIWMDDLAGATAFVRSALSRP